ncbi:MAG: molybdopterin-dependent oxidoreductase [Alphaproteobacteria bacterium]|nr:molybdopterin-dependent oxidoreductase [Alphaproteobacteria bacterium]
MPQRTAVAQEDPVAPRWAELEPAAFMALWHEEPSLAQDPAAAAHHAALAARASVCSYCGVGCPYTVTTDARGREQVEPLSGLGLCVKGQTSLLTGGHTQRAERLARRGLRDDRLRHPMIRGHDGRMKVVSWEEALDRAAWLFLHTREWVGPGAPAIYGNGQKTLEAIWMACLWKLVFKLPTIGANSEHCLASAGAAHELNFGNEASFTWREFDELARCDVAVLHGTNAFITFPQAYEKLARNDHAVKVVIDPVRTDTVSELQALDPRTLHLRFRQGGDVAFNLAVARILLERGWADEAYLARAVDAESLADFRRLINEPRLEPSAVARRLALPGQSPMALLADMQRYARLLGAPLEGGQRPRVAIVSSMGINQSTGSFGFSTNLNLLLLTGNVGRPGAGSLRIAGQSNATSELMMGFNSRRLVFNLNPEDPTHRAELARVLDIPVENIPDAPGTAVSHMADDDHLYCFIFVGTQMTRNMPRLGHWMRRLGRSFNIVIDPFLGDGVLEFADVLLPSMTYTERTGVIQRGDRSLQLQQRQTEPPPEAWSDTRILAQLALAIARRLRDPDTAALNQLDPEVIERAFSRYLTPEGDVDDARVFEHVVQTSRALDLYCRLEDEAGEPLSHARLRARAGRGVQWQGDARYVGARQGERVFKGLRQDQPRQARLVCPPDDLLGALDEAMADPRVGLITGRGTPGERARFMRGRYNSGIKTLPISGKPEDDYRVGLHPDTLAARGLTEGQAVTLRTQHGAVVAEVMANPRVPPGAAFTDFVPGEINRLTDYEEADRFTNQSLIKRTPVSLEPLTPVQQALWAWPLPEALMAAVDRLYARFRAVYAEDEAWIAWQRRRPGAVDWLAELNELDAEALGAFAVFLQKCASDAQHRSGSAEVLRGLAGRDRDRLLTVLLPLLRGLDYQSAMHLLLSDLVGPVTLIHAEGERQDIDLLSAHKSAVLEFKEEIVAIQIFLALKRGVEMLWGPGVPVPREDLAFVSGVAIPCAGDVPAHFLGISPAELGARRLVHCRPIGTSALMVVDTRRNLAVRVDVTTGILPKDRELTELRGVVIAKKRGATGEEHRRFFDRLGELIAQYVRVGDGNFAFFGPVSLRWDELREKLAFAPARRSDFRLALKERGVSAELGAALAQLGVLDPEKDAGLLARLEPGGHAAAPSAAQAPGATLTERIEHVVATVIEPVLRNDGGRLDLLGVDEASGEVTIRFVGSCANCPYSMLSMEQLVKPTLLGVPGVQRVRHRGKFRRSELGEAAAPPAEAPTEA